MFCFVFGDVGEEGREKRKKKRNEKSVGRSARKGERRDVDGGKGNFSKYGCDLVICLFVCLFPS